MVVDGLIHFKFTYHFLGQEEDIHTCDVFAKDANDARWRFSTQMTNAPRYHVDNIEIVESY